MTLRFLAACLLLAAPALAQAPDFVPPNRAIGAVQLRDEAKQPLGTVANPIIVNGSTGGGAVRVTPGGDLVAITSTSTALIPAVAAPSLSVRYQVQGSGFACLSWAATALTISGNTSAATCTGKGAFLFTAGSADARIYPAPLPFTPLYGVAASGASLVLSYEVE